MDGRDIKDINAMMAITAMAKVRARRITPPG
jgi:hypothetical protein